MLKSPKSHVSFILLSTVLAGLSMAAIVNFADPLDSSRLTFGFLYLSLFLFCLGFFSIIGLYIRQWLIHGTYVVNLGNSFRQALLVSTLISVSLSLRAHKLLFWWVEASLILFLFFLEAFLNLKV